MLISQNSPDNPRKPQRFGRLTPRRTQRVSRSLGLGAFIAAVILLGIFIASPTAGMITLLFTAAIGLGVMLKKESKKISGAKLAALICVSVPVLLFLLLVSIGAPVTGGILLLSLDLGLLARLSSLRKRTQLVRQLNEKVGAVVNLHIAALAKRRQQLVTTDTYGTPILNQWRDELNGFINTQILPTVSGKDYIFFGRYKWTLATEIDHVVLNYIHANRHRTAFHEGMSLYEFSQFCAGVLAESGWKITARAGDHAQNGDFIAARGATCVVVRCKLCDQPVDDKAVEGITDDRIREHADYAVLVTNNGFTDAAVQLAPTRRVLVLHYNDLDRFNEILTERDWRVVF